MNTPVTTLLDTKGHDVVTIGKEESVFDAVQTMAEHGVGCLLVMEESAMAGIISERDCFRKVILAEKNAHEAKVGDVMTTKVTTVTPERTLEQCMQIMTAKRFRHLPIVSHGDVKGMISIGDVVKFLCSERGQMIENLEKYITGSM